MYDYSKGKIYKLFSVSNEDLIYYGSTIRTLKKRLGVHISDYKNNNGCTSKKVIAAGDYKIELIEEFPCNSKAELERREGKYIKANKCVNKIIAGRTQKEYNEDNKEQITEKGKEYREDNKDKIKEQKKEWYKNNKEAIIENKKEYCEKNKEAIAERRKVKVTCECGCIITKGGLLTHKKTDKHLELMN
tara:strand:+ start:43 stop:609 length:567 start_codon:yes stop_codon:yes gene_type:complete